MNPLSSELPFRVHNWLIISLKDFCIVIRKWPTFWPSMIYLDGRKVGHFLITIQKSFRGEIPMFVRCTKFVQVHISFIICIIVIVLVNTLRSFKCCICFLYNKYKMVEIYMNIIRWQESWPFSDNNTKIL